MYRVYFILMGPRLLLPLLLLHQPPSSRMAIIALLTLCLLFVILGATGRSLRGLAGSGARGFSLGQLAPLQLSALHRPIMGMRLFVVVGARATEEEQNRLTVFSHDYKAPPDSSAACAFRYALSFSSFRLADLSSSVAWFRQATSASNAWASCPSITCNLRLFQYRRIPYTDSPATPIATIIPKNSAQASSFAINPNSVDLSTLLDSSSDPSDFYLLLILVVIIVGSMSLVIPIIVLMRMLERCGKGNSN